MCLWLASALRASKLAGKETVPAIVRSVSTSSRSNSPLSRTSSARISTRLEEAESYLRLQHEFNLTQEDVAKKVSRAVPQIANIIRLLHLRRRAGRARGGRISMSMPALGLGLEDEDARERMFRRIIEGLTVRGPRRK